MGREQDQVENWSTKEQKRGLVNPINSNLSVEVPDGRDSDSPVLRLRSPLSATGTTLLTSSKQGKQPIQYAESQPSSPPEEKQSDDGSEVEVEVDVGGEEEARQSPVEKNLSPVEKAP